MITESGNLYVHVIMFCLHMPQCSFRWRRTTESGNLYVHVITFCLWSDVLAPVAVKSVRRVREERVHVREVIVHGERRAQE